MADPIPYVPSYSFTGYQVVNPRSPLPADEVDSQLFDIAAAIANHVAAIKNIRRSDGQLKNAIVTYDSLSGDVKARLANVSDTTEEQLEAIYALVVDKIVEDPDGFFVPIFAALPASGDGVSMFPGLNGAGTGVVALNGDTPLMTDGLDGVLSMKDGLFALANPGMVNAANHGLKTTNTAEENAAALNAAITEISAKARGGDIFVPAGEYLFDGAYQVSFPKVNGRYYGLIGEFGTTFKIGGHATDAAFYVGSSVLTNGGSNFVCRNIRFRGDDASNGIAFQLEWANGTRFEGCNFVLAKCAAKLKSSYSVIFESCVFDTVGGANISSSTHCHHLVINKCAVYNAGVALASQFLYIAAGHTDNIVIRDSDFEFCRQIIRADAGCSSFIFEGNYLEFTEVDPFAFGTGAYGPSISGNWIALGDVGWEFHDVTGGEFSRNRIYNQAIGFNADCMDVAVFDNQLSGTATLTTDALRKAISSFLNSATPDLTDIPTYQKVNGVVYLDGKVNDLPGGSLAVLNLPIGYRPQVAKEYALSTGAAATGARLGTSGSLVPYGAISTSVWLSGISFKVDN